MSLTSAQVDFFQTFGYLAFPGLLKDRIGEITAAFEQVWLDHGGGHDGKAHDPMKRSCIVPFIDQSAALCALLDDPRIHGIACDLMGDDFNYMGSDGNLYAGDTGWHSDGWHTKYLHIKFAFYLDDIDGSSGALRVIPGSHHIEDQFAKQLQQKIRECDNAWGVAGDQVPAIAFDITPGDLVLFNHNTKHAAYGGSGRRRMFTINCCQRYAEEDLGQLRDYLSGGARFWIERTYGQTMVDTATPQRMRHLEQVMANDGHLAELARRARREMAEPSRG